MEKFDLHILGCGSAIPTVRHLPTAQILDVRDKLFLIDCAEGTQLQIRRQKLKFSKIGHIFLSHLHGDHCFGLIGLLSTFDLLGRTAPLHVYSPGEDLENLLRPWLNYFCRQMSFSIEFHALAPREKRLIYDDRTLSVETIPLRHRVPCCGFLFREKQTLPHIRRDMIDFLKIPPYAIHKIKAGEGWKDEEGRYWTHEQLTTPAAPARSYAYCSDTIFLPELAQQIKQVDLLYHEATFTQEAESRAKETFHSTAAQAAMLAKEAQVKQLLLGHFSARYLNEEGHLQEAQELFANTKIAHEGLCLSL